MKPYTTGKMQEHILMKNPQDNNSQKKSINVLIVSSDTSARKDYEQILSECGCSVQTTDTGSKALQIMIRETFDAIVADSKIKGIDSFVFIKEALHIWPWLGIVYVADSLSDKIKQKAENMGIKRLLQKPTSRQELWDNVKEAIRMRKEHGDTRAVDNLAHVYHHLRLLAGLEEKAIGTNTLTEALQELGHGLTDIFPFDLLGILGIEDDKPILYFNIRKTITKDLLSRVKHDMVAYYNNLSGQLINTSSPIVKITGKTPERKGKRNFESTLSVPIILDSTISGLLTLRAVAPNVYKSSDISMLYHTANHITSILIALRKMHVLANNDNLTGMCNRKRFEEELERYWLLSQRYGHSLAVIVIDIDYFKVVNDSYGHAVGDEILREFSQIIRSTIRDTDIGARYGGDEFVVILPTAIENEAYALIERLMANTQNHLFCKNTHRLHINVSIGISFSRNPRAPTTSSDLLAQADRALYISKRRGRNRVTTWPSNVKEIEAFPPLTREKAKQDALLIDVEDEIKTPGRIIVFDEDPNIRDAAKIMLKSDVYEITALASPTAVLEEVKAHTLYYDVVLADLDLSGKRSTELLRELKNIDTSIMLVAMTDEATIDNTIGSLRQGACDVVTKPLDQIQLSNAIKRAMEYRFDNLENMRYRDHLEKMLYEKTDTLAKFIKENENSRRLTLEMFAAMLDSRERMTKNHSQEVRNISLALARKIDMNEDEIQAVGYAALLHDIGKITISDAILHKPSQLLPKEWDEIKKHAEIGYKILRLNPHLKAAAEIIWAHHERYDGKGYPRKLHGSQISRGARIIALTDAYAAMRTGRIYHKAMSPEEAAEEICRNSGKQFDPEVVKVFLECQAELEKHIKQRSKLKKSKTRSHKGQ